MKLLRYGPVGAEKPALLDKDGTIRCLSSVVRDIDGFALSAAALQMIAGINEARELIPHENATSLQVVASILGAMVWALKNPRKGMVEPDEDHFNVLAVNFYNPARIVQGNLSVEAVP